MAEKFDKKFRQIKKNSNNKKQNEIEILLFNAKHHYE